MNTPPAWRAARGWVTAAVLVTAVAAVALHGQASRTVIFEGARLVTSDAAGVIDDGVFVVEGARIAAVGRRGSVPVPAGAARVDLAGATVMPALVNGHIHLGYQRGLVFSAANYTRDTIISELNRYAYAGVGAVMSLGTDAGEIASEIRRDQDAGRLKGALVLTAGRGIAPPDAGPANAAMKPAAYGVTTVEDARSAVREQVARGVSLIKIWVDDRGGSVPKLSPELYRAVLDEAHARKARVIAHVYYLADARALTAAGVDAFAHLPRDGAIDEPLAREMKARGVVALPNLSVSENGTHAAPPAWLAEPRLAALAPPEQLERMRASYARRTVDGTARARASYAAMQQSVAQLKAAGAAIAFGTDAGAVQDHVHAFTDHRELQLMVEAGLTPLEAITAATQTAAAFLGLPDRGRLAAGRRADFVVLDADPLTSIANTRRIRSVYLGGEPVDRERLRETFSTPGGRR